MTCSQRSTTDVSRQNLGRAKFKEGLETDIWWELINIPKKHVFQNNILVTIVSPWAPYPGVRWSSWHQKPHPAPSQIQIIRNKTEFPQNSPSMSELLTFTGFSQNRPYNTSQNQNDFSGNCTYDLTFKERDVPQVTILAKEGRRWYGSPEVLSPQPVGNSRALLVVHKS